MIFIVLLFPVAFMAMTRVLDGVEDWLSSRPGSAGRRGLSGAAEVRRAFTGTLWTADETARSTPESPRPSWPSVVPVPVPVVAVPPRPLTPAAQPAEGRPPIPAQYQPAVARAAGWN